MSTFKRLSRQILEIDEVTTGASLSTDTSPTTERIAPVKSWNKFRKIRTPVEDSNPGGQFYHKKPYQFALPCSFLLEQKVHNP